MEEKTAADSGLSKYTHPIKSAFSANKHTLVLGLSSSLNGGAAYGYIASLDYHYFTPALGVVAGLIGGLGIAAKDIFSGNNATVENEKHPEDIPLKYIPMNITFGILALILGYLLVYYFVKIPIQSTHGTIISFPVESGDISDFFKGAMRLEDIVAATLGAVSSLALPILLKKKIRALMQKLKINRVY